MQLIVSRDQEIGRGKVLLMVSGLGPLGDLPSPGPASRVVFGTVTFRAVLFTVVTVICTVVNEPSEKGLMLVVILVKIVKISMSFLL